MATAKHISMSVCDTWGVGCLRQTAGFPTGNGNKFQYTCPIGPSIVVWDIEKKQRVLSKQMTDDFISVLIKNDAIDLILLVSFSGQGKLLNSMLTSVCSFEVPGNNVIYASWLEGGSLFSICTIGHTSSLCLFEVNANKKEVSLKWSVKASTLYRTATQQQIVNDEAHHNDNGVDSATSTTDKDANYQSYYGCMFSEESTMISIFNRQNSPFEIHLYNLDGICLKKKPISPLGDRRTSMLCMSECRNGRFAIGMERGVFVFIESKSLETLSVFQSQGSAQVCLWDGDLLMTVAYQSGVLQWWSTSAEIIKEAKVENAESVIHLNWSIPGKELWIGGVTSLNYVFVQSSPSMVSGPTASILRMLTLTEHKVAGCGLTFKENSILATGDLVGNVFVNKMGTDFKFDDTKGKINIKSSVRCLAWVLDELFIGTLEGTLFKWVVTENGNPSNCELVYNFPFGVLSMRTSNSQKLLAIGTGGGNLYIFDTLNKFHLILETRAHMPQKVGPEMEERFMEIWSIAWEPSDCLIATASEDRSSVVSDTKTGNLVETIKGHTTAVTSIDWKILSNKNCILATCADDRTVRVHDGKSFVLLNILKADNIHGWYTMTYLSINASKDWLLCSTQNGYLVLWDLRTMMCLFCKKLHCGSIEGLEWNESLQNFGSIGSDCIVNVFSISANASSSQC